MFLFTIVDELLSLYLYHVSFNFRSKNTDPLSLSDEESDIEEGELIEVPKKRNKQSTPAAKKPKSTVSTYR